MKRILLLVPLLFLMGCYAATVETGLAPSDKQISQKFASSWIYGLVPPKTVEAAEECENGVAKVQTRLSFVNQVVGFITLGIYTPMEIIVTCASSAMSSAKPIDIDVTVPAGASSEQIREAFAIAAREAVEQGRPMLVAVE